MDAVEYLWERERMLGDPPKRDVDLAHDIMIHERNYPEGAVEMITNWSKAHPRMTNAQKFVEVFGRGPFNFSMDLKWWDAEYKEPGVDNA